MQTLSFGIKKPQARDQGTVLFNALAGNFQQQNDHTHNGADSSKLDSAALSPTTQGISSVGWIAGGGLFHQTVTMPAGLLFNNVSISLRNTATGDPLFLTVEKINATSYKVYINDNSIDLTANYGI